jgi:hypothetical protein
VSPEQKAGGWNPAGFTDAAAATAAAAAAVSEAAHMPTRIEPVLLVVCPTREIGLLEPLDRLRRASACSRPALRRPGATVEPVIESMELGMDVGREGRYFISVLGIACNQGACWWRAGGVLMAY